MYGREMQCGSYGGQFDYAKALARWGQMEVLKEKVKQRMATHYGKRLDKLADLIAEIAIEKAKGESNLEKREEELQVAFDELNGGAQ